MGTMFAEVARKTTMLTAITAKTGKKASRVGQGAFMKKITGKSRFARREISLRLFLVAIRVFSLLPFPSKWASSLSILEEYLCLSWCLCCLRGRVAQYGYLSRFPLCSL